MYFYTVLQFEEKKCLPINGWVDSKSYKTSIELKTSSKSYNLKIYF